MKKIVNVIMVLFMFIPFKSWCQGFKATGLVGLNASQIDGDNLYGFNKLGLSLGGRLSYVTDKSYDFALEMLYSQRGSALNFFNNEPGDKIVLNYFEIPVVFSLRDWYIEDKSYYKVRVESGFSYGYLFRIEASGFEESFFRKHDVSWLVGVGLNFSSRIGVSIRYTTSLQKMYRDPSASQSTLLSYFLTLRTEFSF
ncbi:MAG: PorT family protein [Saprospiraceae bacterium]|nr:PorT family protein [Saprospiraceae bacterium]